MRNLITIALVAILAGCATTKEIPVYVFPDAPAKLMAPPQPLKQIKKSGETDAVSTGP